MKSNEAKRRAKIAAKYCAYPETAALLANRLNATPGEIAMWIFDGSAKGGLNAYLWVYDHDDGAQFRFSFTEPSVKPLPEGRVAVTDDNFDYETRIVDCYFVRQKVETFEPRERYITAIALNEEWRVHFADDAKMAAFIRGRIHEGLLHDLHPITGTTQGSFQGQGLAPIEAALFRRSEVNAIEASDFAMVEGRIESPTSPCQSVNASQIRQHFPVIKSDADANAEWWNRMMGDAKRNKLDGCRVGAGVKGPGGTFWRPNLVASWLLDRHKKGKGKGMDKDAIRAALKKIPDCAAFVDDWFPPD